MTSLAEKQENAKNAARRNACETVPSSLTALDAQEGALAISHARLFRLAVVLLAMLAFALAIAVLPAPQALAQPSPTAKTVATNGHWVTHHNRTYYLVNGKRVHGFVSIGKRNYSFGSKGVQRSGWRLIKGSYYCFRTASGPKANAVHGKVVNGVRLSSAGKARISNKEVKAELKTMTAAQLLVDKITKPSQSRSEKLYTCFRYTYSSAINIRVVTKWSSKGAWWRRFADQIFFMKAGDCNSMGFAVAYLANALGYKKCECVASGGHGWSRVGGRVYDPQQGNFNVGGYARGVNYAANSYYVCNLNRKKIWRVR